MVLACGNCLATIQFHFQQFPNFGVYLTTRILIPLLEDHPTFYDTKESLSQNGLDLRDKELRMQLLKLILILEETEANKNRKKKLDAVLDGYEMESFGKIV